MHTILPRVPKVVAAAAIGGGLEALLGDVDGKGGAEIFVCTNTGQVRAFNSDGSDLWTSTYVGGCLMPSLADLDQDGTPEIIVRGGVLDALTGVTEATFGTVQTTVQAIDIDGDGLLEIAGPSAIYEAGFAAETITTDDLTTAIILVRSPC